MSRVDCPMAQRPVHYVHCDGCNKAPVHGVLMKSTTGAKLTNLCADCFCTFSEHIDDANRKVLLADFGEQLAQYQSILHTEIDEINAHESVIHQLKAAIRQRQTERIEKQARSESCRSLHSHTQTGTRSY